MTRRKMKDSGVAWIGPVPEGWSVLRVKNVGTSRNGLTYSPNDVVNESEGTLVLRSSNIQNGKLALEDCVYVKTTIPKEIRIAKGDILICSRNGSRELIGKNTLIESDVDASFGAFMMVFRSLGADRKFLYWLLNSTMFGYYLGAFATSTINQLTRKDFGEMRIPNPPLPEQRKIAAFLDGECGKIDVLRGKVEKQIAALEEYRKSVITEAVTKGIKRGRKMKPSGVEWIGEVPEDWQMSRLKNHAVITTGNLDTQDANPDGDYPFYVRSPIVERADTYTFEGPGILMAGDGAGAGRIFHLATGKYAVHQRVYRLFRFKDVDAKFLWRYLSVIFPKVMDMGSAQSTVPSVRMPMLSNLRMFVPHLPEQREIAAYLDKKCAAIDSMVAKCREELDRLAEYKKSLIYEYVTGKKEVA